MYEAIQDPIIREMMNKLYSFTIYFLASKGYWNLESYELVGCKYTAPKKDVFTEKWIQYTLPHFWNGKFVHGNVVFERNRIISGFEQDILDYLSR
jgi:hypothetical protein